MYVCCMPRKCQCPIPRMTCKPLTSTWFWRGFLLIDDSLTFAVPTCIGYIGQRGVAGILESWHPGTMICGNLFLRFIIVFTASYYTSVDRPPQREHCYLYIHASSHLFNICSMFFDFFCPAAIISTFQRQHLRCSTICFKSRTGRWIIGPASD